MPAQESRRRISELQQPFDPAADEANEQEEHVTAGTTVGAETPSSSLFELREDQINSPLLLFVRTCSRHDVQIAS